MKRASTAAAALVATTLACLVLPAPSRTAVGAPAENNTPGKWEDPASRYDQIRREHWAFQPIRGTTAPAVKDSRWAKGDIDRYVLAGLEKKGLAPAPPADRRTLIRRAAFDLTGLPPTPEQIEEFVNDRSTRAFENLVDRLLASPAFGERWGRHWLDVARYAESTGMTRNVPLYYAWRYRDYVIDSFNKDKPFDRFVTEQLAGDLLPARTPAERDEQTIATGFLALGPKDLNERNQLQFVMNTVDEQIDATGQAILGLTISCARCHDHKFDPIPTSQYYAMAGIFRSTQVLAGVKSRRGGGGRDYYSPELLVQLGSAGSKPAARRDDGEDDDAGVTVTPVVAKQKGKQGKKAQAKAAKRRERRMRREAAAAAADVEIQPLALGVKESILIADSNVFVRGELDQPGPVVPRGVVALPGMGASLEIPAKHSGRLELAKWATSRQNPLTSRVAVNRIWQHLFGQGLVRTSDNFGTTGEPPSHPELLDHLALQFMSDGWSVKRMVRRVMLSSAYQQSSAYDAKKFEADPENRLLWRMSQRRLEAEAIRDAVLSVSGKLDPARPAGSPVLRVPPVDIGRRRRLEPQFGDALPYRSVYLPVLRGLVPEVLDVFDMPDPNMVSGRRDVTTVAPQALFMMNDPFVVEQSRHMARRVLSERRGSDAARVDYACAMAVGRPPTGAERDRVLAYVRGFIRSEDAGGKGKPAGRDRESVDEELVAAWGSFCQALIASAEFRYLN